MAEAASRPRYGRSLVGSGGGKQAQYYVSGGYFKEDGILRYAKMDFERMNLVSNLSSRLTPWLKLKLNFSDK